MAFTPGTICGREPSSNVSRHWPIFPTRHSWGCQHSFPEFPNTGFLGVPTQPGFIVVPTRDPWVASGPAPRCSSPFSTSRANPSGLDPAPPFACVPPVGAYPPPALLRALLRHKATPIGVAFWRSRLGVVFLSRHSTRRCGTHIYNPTCMRPFTTPHAWDHLQPHMHGI